MLAEYSASFASHPARLSRLQSKIALNAPPLRTRFVIDRQALGDVFKQKDRVRVQIAFTTAAR
jgi:hypothetical protein